MSNVKAPPLGQLDSGTIDDLLDSADLPTPQIETTSTPAKEMVFTRPGTTPLKAPTKDVAPDFFNGATTNIAPTTTPTPPTTTPTPPINTQLRSLQTSGMSDTTVGDLTQSLAAGNESTPFNYDGRRAGTNLDQGVRVDPSAGLPRIQTELGSFVSNKPYNQATTDAVVANGTPVNQFQYTEGLTTSQQNTRDFFGGLQDFRKGLAPSLLPALLYTPQQLNPSVAGGFAPTAETKGPLSWLIGEPTEDINPLKGDFGASGQGLLGGLGWVFSRLSPTTYLKGVAMDVARSVAAGYEGGSAGLEALLKGGNFGDAFVSAASENFYANAPQARGLPVKSIFGSREAGDFFTQSYTLSALSGANDTSFSGQGNNTLFTDGGNRNIVNKGESFNPFGTRDPFRSGFNTGRLEAQERSKGSWFGHGYDQAGMFGVGLVADIFLEGRIDKVVSKSIAAAVKSTTKATTQVTRNSDDFTRGLNALRRQSVTPTQLRLPPAREPLPDLSVFTTPPKNSKVAPSRKGPEVIQGEFVPSVADIKADNLRRAEQFKRSALQPIEQRYLPPGRDPFVVPETPRAYSPNNTDLAGVAFDSGGAIVPYSVKRGVVIDTSEGGKIVPAILGVGGKPGGIPTIPRVEDGRVFIAKGADPVTVWDPNSNQFVSSVSSGPARVERVLKAPGKVDLPNTPTPKNTPLVEPPSGLSGDVLPVLVPKNTPNFTVQPSLDISPTTLANHVLDVTTGVLRQDYTTPAKTGIGEIFTPPPPQVTSVAAEALTPSASSADLVRNMLNDTTPTTYNPTLLAKEPRDISSMTVLAQTIMLPGGVRVLDEVSAKDVKSFHQLNKAVESAIVSAGLNPSSPEVNAIRRMFDRMGPNVPNKLDSDFVVEVAPRTLDVPTSYVKPAQASSLLDDMWSPRANTSTPAKPEYVLGINKSDGVGVPLTKDNLLSVSVNERKALVGKSVSDGYEVPTGAVKDATSPDIVKDVQAAKDYASTLPKTDRPTKLDLDTRTKLKEHQQTTQELMYTNDLITDVSTQLTDVEVQLSKYLKQVDELPDIGVYPLVDKVPTSPLTKDIILPKIYDVEDIYVDGEIVRKITDIVPFGVIGDDGVTLNLAAGKLSDSPRPNVTILTKEQLPDALSQVDEFTKDFTGVLNGKTPTPPRILDLDSLDVTVMPNMPDSEIITMFKQGAFMTPVVKRTGGTELDPVFTVVSGERYVSAYKRAKHLDPSLVDRMSVRFVDDLKPTPAKKSVPTEEPYKLYHGTRVDKLDLASVDPVMGATRSEYGTGVWLTRDQGIATAASGRAVPNNTVPLSGREFSDTPTVHELDSSILAAMNVVKSTDTVSPNVLKEMPLDGRLFSDIISYGDDLTEGLVDLLGTSKTTYGELFDKVDDLVRSKSLKNTGNTADEYELTYVQRVVTDMLRNKGVDGVTNGTNTVIYRTNNLLTNKVHNVTDLVGDSSNSVNLALHEVNLLQRSLDAEPGSKLLKVQLAEAKAVAASRVRDSLADELAQLTSEQTKLVSKLMRQDDIISDVAKTQRSQDLIGATVKDENTFDAFTKELNRNWDTPCL